MEPHSLVGGMGKVVSQVAWPAASKTNASWPAHQLRRREKWFVDGRRKGKPNGYSLPSPKVPTTSPARPAGGYGPLRALFAGGLGQVSRKKSTASPHNPTRRVQREEPLPSGVLSPISSQEMGPRLGKPSFPPVPTAPEKELPPKAKPEGNLNPPQKQPSPTISCVAFLSPPHPLPGEN